MADIDPSRTDAQSSPETPVRSPDQVSTVVEMIGRRLGEYQIEAKIGAGGMGQVFRARHVRLGKLVALKVLPAQRFDDPRAVDRFLREIKAVGRLEHPNIVLARDAGEIEGIYFLVMELLEGSDLSALLRKSGPMGVGAACELIRQAALGLQHAHEQGLVHRDLKPSNLMLTPSGVVKVLDVGLALILDASPHEVSTDDGAILGTFDYMAPEQWSDSHNVDIRADLYSLGCTLYALLVGEPPFSKKTHPTTLDKMKAHLGETPPSILRRRPDVPESVGLILDRLLAKQPSTRYARPSELAEALTPLSSADDLRWLLSSDRIEPAVASAPAPKPPPGPVDEVQFTVYRPRVLVPLRWHPMLVFTHLLENPPDAPAGTPEPIEEVRKQAETILGPRKAADYQQSTQDSTRDVPREGVLTLIPSGVGLEFNPAQRSFRWEERVHREEFRIRAPASLEGQTVKGRVSAYLGTILIAEVALRFRVETVDEPESEAPMEPVAGRMFRRIFASFARDDRSVVDQFERFARALGDEYLSRCTTLRAGDAWDDRVRELIDQADVFQLFWSRNALRSPMVEHEWRHALALARPSFIRPVYWEDPLPADPERGLPPDDLRRLYFQKLEGIETRTEPEPPRPRSVRPNPPAPADDPTDFDLEESDSDSEVFALDEGDIDEIDADETGFDEVELDDEDDREDLDDVEDLAEDDDDDFEARVESDRKIEPPQPEDEPSELTSMTSPGLMPASPGLASLASGMIVAERYRLVEVEGRGGMGVSWVVEEVSGLGRTMVMEVPPVSVNLAFVEERVRWEARLPRNCVERIRDAGGMADGSVYIVRDRAGGRPLSEFGRSLDPVEVLELIARVADGLQEIHDSGAIHGHLKPLNILVGDRSRIQFRGLAFDALGSVRNRSTGSGAIEGTPAYMAPEQITESPLDGRTDLYALGVILLELLTGAPPFRGGTPLSIIHRKMTQPPPSLAMTPRGAMLPRSLVELVDRMLSTSPDPRPRTAREVAEELRAHARPRAAPSAAAPPPAPMATAPVQAMPSPKIPPQFDVMAPAPEPVGPRSSPIARALAFLLLLILILVGGLALAWFLRR